MAVESATGDKPCPDPSAHEHANKLSAQASTAALYVTHSQRATTPKETPKESVLGSDGKLSSKGAAASLKYAKPQDLPSFPSAGGSMSSAGAAAGLAKDYKMKDLWQPESSAAGSAAAAMAHRDGGKLDLWQPSASKDGNSAAVLAMRNKGLSPQLDRGYTKTGQSNALLAATKSQKSTRSRAESTPSPAPQLYPDQANSAFNALNAATVSHRGSVKSPPPAPKPKEEASGQGYSSAAMQAARIQNIGATRDINPEMWGEHPPIRLEEEERKQKAALRASAISMAKQMYEYQNRTVLGPDPSGNAGAEAATARAPPSTAPADLKQEALRYIHLQDAAQKLADERLAKVDKNFEAAKYREYYGYNAQPQRSRLSMRGRPRRRASSDGKQYDDSSDDEEAARRVRSQMNQFSKEVADIDAKKQSSDRKALLAAASRNVTKELNTMDERAFQETGKVSQTKMDEWAAKARQKAERESALRTENHGKMHVGGGKFMANDEIERIAQARLQPTLDEINDTAEKKRAHDEEMRLEREEQERVKRDEKQKQREEKDEQRRVKNEEKAAAKKEKDERKAAENERKAAEKAEKAEQRKSVEAGGGEEPGKRKSFLSRLASKRKSRDVKKEDSEAGTGTATGTAVAGGTAAAAATATDSTDKKDADAANEAKEEVEEPAEADKETKDPKPPALERSHTGSDNDAVATPKSSPSKKPDLERHISKIEASSSSESEAEWDGASSSSSSDDEGNTKGGEKEKHKSVPLAAAGSSGAVAAEQAKENDGHDEAHAREVADRVENTPVTAESKSDPPRNASTTTSEPRQSTASSRPSEQTEPSGFRGFFSKLRSRSSKVPTATDSAERANSGSGGNREPTVGGTPATATTAADDAKGKERAGSVSPSSFTRGRGRDSAEAADVSSLSSSSSSGLDEDDLVAGRTGRMARALGKGKGDKPKVVDVGSRDKGGKGVVSGTDGEEDESDQFEEARDTFDEGLAPRPAFGGQAKSQSPARETRFHEEV